MRVMPSCHEVREHLTDYLEGSLPLRKRIGIRLHLMMCDACDGLRRALEALPRLAKQALAPPPQAPPEAKAVLGQILKQIKGPSDR